MQNYDDMDVMQLWKIRDATKNPKELRKIHKALKKKGRYGVDFFDRYPYFPLIISIISFLLVYLKPVIINIFR